MSHGQNSFKVDYMYIYIYVYIYVCVYVYIYIYSKLRAKGLDRGYVESFLKASGLYIRSFDHVGYFGSRKYQSCITKYTTMTPRVFAM